MKSFFCFFVGFLMLSGAAVATDESVNDLADRLDRMEDALKDVQKKLSNNYVGSIKRPSGDVESVSDDKADVLLLQLQEVEQTLRQLTGEVETARFKQEELQNRIDRVNADTTVRFSEMEKKLAAAEDKIKKMEEEKNSAEKAQKEAEKKKKEQAAAAAKAAKNKEAELKEIYGKKTAKELYDQAFSSIKKKDHKAAQAEFEAFLTLYPKNALAGNAQYWLGESFFARSMYQKAAVAFAEGFKNYRESQKAPDNLFKLGVTMARMNKKEEACVAFKNFTKEYPKVSDTMKKRLEAEVQKLSCP